MFPSMDNKSSFQFQHKKGRYGTSVYLETAYCFQPFKTLLSFTNTSSLFHTTQKSIWLTLWGGMLNYKMQGSTCTRLSETSIMFVGFQLMYWSNRHLRKWNFSVKTFYCDGSTAVSGFTCRAGVDPWEFCATSLTLVSNNLQICRW